jgi:acetyltransferase-like isoleucine patch superfamily enzyme
VRKILRYLFNIFFAIINVSKFKYYKIKNYTKIKNIRGTPFIRNKGNFIIKEGVKINSRYSANPIGGQTFCTFIVKNNADLIINKNAGISNSTIVCWGKIIIGENVYIGGDCKIYDTDFHSLKIEKRISKKDNDVKTKPIIIKDGAFIGGGSIILKGVTIGENAIIGAGSVVTKDIPPYEIWAGNPAKFIRKL